MKINYAPKLNKNNQDKSCLKNNFLEQNNTNTTIANTSSTICQCSFGQAQVNMQKKCAAGIINNIIGSTCKIKRHYITKKGIERFEIGKPIDGWNDLLETVSHATCQYNESGKLKRIFIQSNKTFETKVYNALENVEKIYSPEDMQALKYYKYHPDSIHDFLRYGRHLYSGDWAKETNICINKLDEIFENNAFKSDKPMKLYRGMHTGINNIGGVGDTYKDSSFVSTSTDIDVAKRFAGNNPIMEITFPKGSKYIDMDSLFNIDREHWREDEYLLNRNSKFLITDYDKITNIVKAEFIP